MHVALSAANIPAATRRATPNFRLRDPVASRRVRENLPNVNVASARETSSTARISLSARACQSLAPTLTPSLADTLSPQATARPSLVRAARHVAMPSAAVDPDATAVLFDFDGTLG